MEYAIYLHQFPSYIQMRNVSLKIALSTSSYLHYDYLLNIHSGIKWDFQCGHFGAVVWTGNSFRYSQSGAKLISTQPFWRGHFGAVICTRDPFRYSLCSAKFISTQSIWRKIHFDTVHLVLNPFRRKSIW